MVKTKHHCEHTRSDAPSLYQLIMAPVDHACCANRKLNKKSGIQPVRRVYAPPDNRDAIQECFTQVIARDARRLRTTRSWP